MFLWGSPFLHLTVSATKCILAPVALPGPPLAGSLHHSLTSTLLTLHHGSFTLTHHSHPPMPPRQPAA